MKSREEIEKEITDLEKRVKGLEDKSKLLGWNVKISKSILDDIRKIAEEYAHIDGAHHKQYALVLIARMLDSEVEFYDEGIPA